MMDKTLERICYTGLLILTPVISDHVMSETYRQTQRAVLDNVTHLLIGVFSWLVIEPGSIRSSKQCWSLIAVAILSSVIDIDHMIAAKSFNYKDAFHATHRGIFHSSGLLLVMNLVCFCVNFEWGVILMVSWIPHHLRDSTRRGLYLIPPQIHTNPIPSNLVSFITITLPWIITYIRTRSLNQPIRDVFNV